MSSRLIIAAGDISTSPVLARRFRGKAAKEIYRCSRNTFEFLKLQKKISVMLN